VLTKMLTAHTSEWRERLRLDTVFLHPSHKLELGVLDGELHLVWTRRELRQVWGMGCISTYSRLEGTWQRPEAASSGRC
jgi:hypothetical protein